MKTAYSIYGTRIAPVFDTARDILIVESRGQEICGESLHKLEGRTPAEDIAWLQSQGVKRLVCGAVSRPLHEMIIAAGIQTEAFVTGEVRQVISAALSGLLNSAVFAMPGCCGRRRMRRACSGGGRGAGRGLGRGLGRGGAGSSALVR